MLSAGATSTCHKSFDNDSASSANAGFPVQYALFGVFGPLKKDGEIVFQQTWKLYHDTEHLVQSDVYLLFIIYLFILTVYSLTILQMFTSANHEEVLCIQYIFTIPEEPLAISRHFLHTCFEEGPLITFTHHHLCHSATLTGLINQRAEKKASNEQLANEMALFNVDL